MDYKGLARGLGWFSIALGATELLFANRITKALEVEGHEGLVRGFGVREVVAGLGLLDGPAHSTRMWNRVVGDAADMAALTGAARKSPDNGAVWGAIAFVAGAAILDAWVAIGLDGETGKALT